MKRLLILVLCLGRGTLPVPAAEGLSATLQRGLFEEEANNNPDAAIKAYESVVAATDAQRPLAATALFRLAECERKLGRTNAATRHYERVLRDYPDQSRLTELSRLHAGAGDAAALAALAQNEPLRRSEASLGDAQGEMLRLMTLYTQLTNLSRADLRRVIGTVYPDELLRRLEEQRMVAEQQLAVATNSFGLDHPEVRSVRGNLDVLTRQISERLDGILDGLRVRLEAESNRVAILKMQLSDASGTARLSAPGTSTEQRKLLQEELKAVESLLADAQVRVKMGVLPATGAVREEQEVLRVQRELAALDEPPGGPRQRALLQKEIQLADQLVSDTTRKAEAGTATSAERIAAQRDLSALKRELLRLQAAAQNPAGSRTRPSSGPHE